MHKIYEVVRQGEYILSFERKGVIYSKIASLACGKHSSSLNCLYIYFLLQVHPSADYSLFRAVQTHNLRLKENVLRSKLKLHPNSTWLDWITTVKKRKKLRWFTQGTENYNHCIIDK